MRSSMSGTRRSVRPLPGDCSAKVGKSHAHLGRTLFYDWHQDNHYGVPFVVFDGYIAVGSTSVWNNQVLTETLMEEPTTP